MSDCWACWICGRSVLGVRIYDAVPELQADRHLAWVKDPSLWTVALLRTFCVEHGLGRFFYCFFSFHFPVSQCTYVSVCFWLQFSDRCRHICPTCVRKLGPLMMLLIRRKTVYKRLAEWNVKRCASNNEVNLCKFSIHQHCKLIMKKSKKKNQRKVKKKKKKKNKKKRWSSFTAPKETHQDCAWLQVLCGIREMSWL